MTRLFIRLYLSMLVVLFLAWYLHGALLRQRAAADDKQRERQLSAFETASEELDELLRHVRLETSGEQLDLGDVDLLPVIDGLVKKHVLLHPHISFSLGDELLTRDLTVQVNDRGMQRAIGNLVSNASARSAE